MESVMHPIISSSVAHFSFCLQSFSASESFPISWVFTSRGQSIGISASATVLPVNIQGWFLFGLTGLISLQSKGLFKESLPAPQFESINSSMLSLLYDPTLVSVHDNWNTALTMRTFVGKVMSLRNTKLQENLPEIFLTIPEISNIINLVLKLAL